MDRARRHQRLLARLALGLLALVAELVGRSLTDRLDVGRHVASVGDSGQSYYPFLVGAVKISVALMLARLAWRLARAHATARAARRLAAAVGVHQERRSPRVRIALSPRLWLASFVVTSSIYLLQTDAEQAAADRLRLLAPWLHTSALPVFAVLSVVVAVVYRAVEGWLGDVERLAADALAFARRLVTVRPGRTAVAHPRPDDQCAPRALFGLDFESRPPPLAA
jgi:hypothetical protein